MMNTWQLRFAILCVLVNGFSNFCFAAAPPDGNPRTVYFTVGDTQDLFDFPPLDSRTSIAAAFETLQQQWQVERIWWRGGQDEVWGEEFVIRRRIASPRFGIGGEIYGIARSAPTHRCG
jgi:hypothetical protein